MGNRKKLEERMVKVAPKLIKNINPQSRSLTENALLYTARAKNECGKRTGWTNEYFTK